MLDTLYLASILLQDDDVFGAIFGGIFATVYCICASAFFLIVVIGLWKIYTKADQPGWAAIIPIYNIYVLTEIIGRPWWWLLLLFIPFVNIVISIIMAIDLAQSFGKDAAYGVILLWLFNVIGYLMLGFGDAEYLGPAAAQK